jgi:lipopolysaccharide export LptBFGC system permease protein LptF
MHFRYLAALVICLATAGCQPWNTVELEKTRAELARVQAQLATQQTLASSRRLVHLVWFRMKDGAGDEDRERLIAELKKLGSIDVVHDLEIGRFQDLGDSRAMADLDVVMQMGFRSQEDYATYQSHPVHLNLKRRVGDFIDTAPVTYDYWSE